MVIIKFSETGNKEWAVEAGAPSNDEVPGRLVQGREGSLVVTGHTKNNLAGLNDIFVFKLNEQGHKEWSRIIGGSGSERAFAATRVEPSGYVLCGEVRAKGEIFKDALLVKISEEGLTEWAVRIGDLGAD